MSIYRYYIPNTPTAAVTPELLESLGLTERLWDVMDRTQYAVLAVNDNGPDGSSGSLVVPHRADKRPLRVQGFKPGEFESHKSHHGDYWITWDIEEPPTPDGLQRQKLVDGYEFGAGWVAPVIRRSAFVPAVPCTYAKLNGQLTREPHADYSTIWDRSAEWFDRYFSSGIPVSDQFDIAVECLTVNYRVAAEELSLLQLLDEDSMQHVVRSALDVPWIEEAIEGADPKKKELWDQVQAALVSTSHGEADSTADTSQATETSCLLVSE